MEIEERLRFLEAHVEVQEALLVAMHAERIEAERLSDSVVRLGLGADSLGAALRTVDENQRLLATLAGRADNLEATAATKTQVAQVEKDAATKNEMRLAAERQAEAVERARRDIVAKSTGIVVVIGACLLAMAVFVVDQRSNNQRVQYTNCLASERTLRAVDYYLGQVQRVSENPDLAAAAGDVIRNLRIPDCAALR